MPTKKCAAAARCKRRGYRHRRGTMAATEGDTLYRSYAFGESPLTMGSSVMHSAPMRSRISLLLASTRGGGGCGRSLLSDAGGVSTYPFRVRICKSNQIKSHPAGVCEKD
jgi:hypothetical protein